MRSRLAQVVDKRQYIALREEYRACWGIDLVVTDQGGTALYGKAPCRCADQAPCHAMRRQAVEEALRWGEPTIRLCPQKHFLWGLPCMFNRQILGGVIAEVPEDRVFPDDTGRPALDIVRAAADLMRLLEGENLTNADLLQANQAYHRAEQSRAEAIHEYKALGIFEIRDLYNQTEPALLQALRQGDKVEARGHINRLLTAMLHKAGGKLDLIKGLFLELVITMYRTAVELGGEGDNLLGRNYAALVELARIDTEEELARWLSGLLDAIMESIHAHSRTSLPFQLHMAMEYMKSHLAQDITRDEAARIAGMSPAHFSRQFKRHYRRSFSDFLSRLRVDKACELLIRTDHPLVEIALAAGFTDQSYMNKVFRRAVGITPQRYRYMHR